MALVCLISTATSFVSAAENVTSGSIAGAVKFTGTKPVPKPIDFRGDPFCQRLYAGKTVYHDDVVVNPNGTLANVFVYLKNGPPNIAYQPRTPAPVLDQKGCIYLPHAVGMMAGQELKVLNSDSTFHNVRAEPKNNPKFNLAMINEKAAPVVRKFNKPEPVPFKIACDVHPWMATYVGVFDHPFFHITAEDGTFTLQGVPAGDYVLVAWHERYGLKEQRIVVGDGETKQVTFAYDGTERPK
jgi:hypothetical protein